MLPGCFVYCSSPSSSLSPPISPKSTHSTLILFFFLHLNEMSAFAWRMVGRFPCLLPYGGSRTGVGEPHALPFPKDALAHFLWCVWQKVWEGSKPQKTISFNLPYYHATSQGGQRFLQSFWNNKGHSDELSLIEQSLPIMGSSFPIFTTFCSIPERGMKKTLNFHWRLAPVGHLCCFRSNPSVCSCLWWPAWTTHWSSQCGYSQTIYFTNKCRALHLWWFSLINSC